MKPARAERKAEAHLSGHGHRLSRFPMRCLSFSPFLGNLEFNVQAACSAAHVRTHANRMWFLLRVPRPHGWSPMAPCRVLTSLVAYGRNMKVSVQAWTPRTHPRGTAPARAPMRGECGGLRAPCIVPTGPCI